MPILMKAATAPAMSSQRRGRLRQTRAKDECWVASSEALRRGDSRTGSGKANAISKATITPGGPATRKAARHPIHDASAALILDLARSNGAHVQWLGQHSAIAGATRHHLLSADSAQGCALHLGQQLHACGGGFSLSEEHPLGGQPLKLTGAARSGGSAQWAASLGYSLAGLGGADSSAAPRIASHQPALAGQFVSFSIVA